MGLCDDVRRHCAEVAASARFVSIDLDAAEAIEPGPPPALDPRTHYLEGGPEETAAFLLTLDAINFGSGWFPTLRKRPGRSGYFTLAVSLRERFATHGRWSAHDLARIEHVEVAAVTGQDPGHELVRLWTDSLRALGERVSAEHGGDW